MYVTVLYCNGICVKNNSKKHNTEDLLIHMVIIHLYILHVETDTWYSIENHGHISHISYKTTDLTEQSEHT